MSNKFDKTMFESFLKFSGHPMVKPGYNFDNNPVSDIMDRLKYKGKKYWLYKVRNYIIFRKKYQKRFVGKIEKMVFRLQIQPKI